MKNSFKNNIFMIFDKVAELKKRNEFVQKTNSGLVYFTQNSVLKPTLTMITRVLTDLKMSQE